MENALRTLFLGVALCLGSMNAHAILVNNGGYTTDTETGMDWLDVTVTQNMSYQAVSSQLGVGGAYVGWRYATSFEFLQLVDGFSGNTHGTSINYVDSHSLYDLVTLLGFTSEGRSYSVGGGVYNYDMTNGILGPLNDKIRLRGHIISYERDCDPIYTTLNDRYSIYEPSTSLDSAQSPFIGSYLVRATQYVPPTNEPVVDVPEPDAALLLALGLAGLGFSRKRR